MRLTAEMREEFNFITARLDAIHNDFSNTKEFSNAPEIFLAVQSVYSEELNVHKIKLEILFAETDKKVQKFIFSALISLYIYLI